MAIGSRSQSARTYLEKHLDEFPDCDTDELIKHGLRALRDTLPNEVELNTKVLVLMYTACKIVNFNLKTFSILVNYIIFNEVMSFAIN